MPHRPMKFCAVAIRISIVMRISASAFSSCHCPQQKFATILKQQRSLKTKALTATKDDTSFSFGGDSYWLQQIRKQGEERGDLQWFKGRSSLPFSCTACGKCCKTKGSVYMSPDEHDKAAKLLKISKKEFIQNYVSHTISDEDNGDWVRLLEKSGTDNDNDHGCIFLNDDNTCQVYEARPTQCSTYPFWPNFLKSEGAWNREVRRVDNDTSSNLPAWSAEAGGCEGMSLIGSEKDVLVDEGVPLLQVYEQLHLYEFAERRHPHNSEEVPVHRPERTGRGRY